MLRNWTIWLCVIVIAIVLTAAVAGCGDSGSQAANLSSTTSNPSKVFLKPGSPTNPLVEFGNESTASERQAAAVVLAKNLRAREDADFKTQCATIAPVVAEKLSPDKKGSAAMEACPEALEQLAKPLNSTKPFRRNHFDGEIDALRVKGNGGDALYHGTDKKDYAMPMVKNENRWLVGNITAITLNPYQADAAKTGPSE